MKTKLINCIKVIATLSLIVIALFTLAGCDNSETPATTTCEFTNPLEDLPWLKAKIDEIALTIESGHSITVSIYQCIYGNKETGFLIDIGNIAPFYNCEGEVLCTMGGVVGETCPELNITSRELIWEVDYSAEIPFVEYSLGETLCQWKRLPEDYFNNGNFYNTVVIINSNEELENYIECTDENNYPDVDFSKYTLLLAYGVASSSVVVNCNDLQQQSEQRYKMNVDLLVGNATVITYWQVPIIINKLNEECIIELTITIVNEL